MLLIPPPFVWLANGLLGRPLVLTSTSGRIESDKASTTLHTSLLLYKYGSIVRQSKHILSLWPSLSLHVNARQDPEGQGDRIPRRTESIRDPIDAVFGSRLRKQTENSIHTEGTAGRSSGVLANDDRA